MPSPIQSKPLREVVGMGFSIFWGGDHSNRPSRTALLPSKGSLSVGSSHHKDRTFWVRQIGDEFPIWDHNPGELRG